MAKFSPLQPISCKKFVDAVILSPIFANTRGLFRRAIPRCNISRRYALSVLVIRGIIGTRSTGVDVSVTVYVALAVRVRDAVLVSVAVRVLVIVAVAVAVRV